MNVRDRRKLLVLALSIGEFLVILTTAVLVGTFT